MNQKGTLITLSQVQAIQGAKAPARSGKPRVDWTKLRKVKAGSNIAIPFGPTSARTDSSVVGLCGPPTMVVYCPPTVPPAVDQGEARTIAAGVAEGLRRAPIISVDQAPWNRPGYRGFYFPKTFRVVLSTFGATNVRTVMAQKAMAGYLGTTNLTINTAVPVSTAPVQVCSFLCPDPYHGEDFSVSCQDLQILYLSEWTVAVNGRTAAGPYHLVDGIGKMNVQARRGDTISINIVIRPNDSFVVPIVVQANGWTYPATVQTDGTYAKVLRSSPSWAKKEGVQ